MNTTFLYMHTHAGGHGITVGERRTQKGHVQLVQSRRQHTHAPFIHLSVSCTCFPPSHIHCLTHLHIHTQQMLCELKFKDGQFKELMPKYLAMEKTGRRLQARAKRAVKEALEQKERATLLESQLEACEKVCNKTKHPFTFTHLHR